MVGPPAGRGHGLAPVVVRAGLGLAVGAREKRDSLYVRAGGGGGVQCRQRAGARSRGTRRRRVVDLGKQAGRRRLLRSVRFPGQAGHHHSFTSSELARGWLPISPHPTYPATTGGATAVMTRCKLVYSSRSSSASLNVNGVSSPVALQSFGRGKQKPDATINHGRP